MQVSGDMKRLWRMPDVTWELQSLHHFSAAQENQTTPEDISDSLDTYVWTTKL